MQFSTTAGQTTLTDHKIEIVCKANGALNYGDVVIFGTQVPGDPTPVVQTTTTADNALVAGVVSEPNGIATGKLGRVCVFGLCDCNVVSGTHNQGTALTTSTTAGSADDGTETILCMLGKVAYTAGGTVTTVKAWVNVG